MNDDFLQVDPEWLWSPHEPSDASAWNRRAVAHLCRRAGFGAAPEFLDGLVALTPLEAAAGIVAQNRQQHAFDESAQLLVQAVLASGDPRRLSAAWVYRLLHTPQQLLEKMTLFWHGHFATSADKVQDAELMWDQNQLLREHALGEFAPLVQGIARDPAMLIYLDSASNRKAHPNENFARELMELFCLGEGNYSEADVQELSRCFTGWEIKNRRFRKNRYQQDRETKRLFGRSGDFDGEQGVREVLSQPSMPYFICRKLVRFLVCDEPTFSDRLLKPLADQFTDSHFSVGPLVQRILASRCFYSQWSRGRKIRSPVEYAVGMMRSLGVTSNTVLIAEGLDKVGQGLFYPPNVKGWDGGRSWINSSTLIGRANLVARILDDETTKFEQGQLSELLATQNLDASDWVEWLDEVLLAVPLTASQKDELKVEQEQIDGDLETRLRHTLHSLMAMPIFQIG